MILIVIIMVMVLAIVTKIARGYCRSQKVEIASYLGTAGFS